MKTEDYGRDHVEACEEEDCQLCENAMEFYAACDGCGYWMFGDAPGGYYSDPATGKTLCRDCEPKVEVSRA